MARHEVEITRTAEKQLGKFEHESQVRLAETLLALADNPRPRGCRKLAGYDDVYRLLVGSFRVIYSISDERLVVLIIKVAHRRNAYR